MWIELQLEEPPLPRCDHCGALFELRGDLVIEAVIAVRHAHSRGGTSEARFFPTCNRCGRRSELEELIGPACKRPFDVMLFRAEQLRARNEDGCK